MSPRIIAAVTIVLLAATTSAKADSAPWSDGFSPPPSDDTWIRLKSGEWIKGELEALYDERLMFDSDHFNTISIKIKDVRELHGRTDVEITLRDRSVVTGNLQIRGEQVTVTIDDNVRQFARSELVSILPVRSRERDRWHGDASFGLNVRDGNTEITEFTLAAGIERRTALSRVNLDYLGNTNDTDGERIADSHRANLSFDRFTGRRFFWRPASVQYYRDEFQNIAQQATVDTGAGYRLVTTPRVDWELQAGIGGNYLENVSVTPGEPNGDWSPVTTFGSDLEVELTSWLDYELLINTTFLESRAGKYQHHILSTLSTDLIGSLDLDVSFIWDRTEEPQVAEDGTTPEKDDFRFIVSLGYEF